MKIGDKCFVSGYIDEIRKDTVIVRNSGGYFGTSPGEVITVYNTAHPNWIPCSERLPELDVYVIATTQWYEITMACRIGDGEWFINEGVANAYDDDVIAWMPLPEPYQEGEQDENR